MGPWFLLRCLIIVGILLKLVTSIALANGGELRRYSIDLRLPEGNLVNGRVLQARVTLQTRIPTTELCLYLPYNDPLFYHDPAQQFARRSREALQQRPEFGEQFLEEYQTRLEIGEISPFLVRLKVPADRAATTTFNFDYSFVLPHWSDREGEQFLFYRFYPQPLNHCPGMEELHSDYDFAGMRHMQVKLSGLEGWQVQSVHQQQSLGDSLILEDSRDIVFNITRGYQQERFDFDGLTLRFVFTDKTFLNRLGYIKSFLKQLQYYLGPYPFKELIFLESEELEPSKIDSFVILNRPKQIGMQVLQEEYLNWILWQICQQLGEQWYGVGITPNSQDSAWFFRGQVEFYTYLILKEDSRIFNLFRSEEGGQPWFHFNHRQGTDLAASLLGVLDSGSALVDEKLNSRRSAYEQNGFAYVRHLLAMRYLYWLYGDQFLDFVRSFTVERMRSVQKTSHKDFYQAMAASSELQDSGFAAADLLKLWWTSDQWPDFRLLETDCSSFLRSSEDCYLKVDMDSDFVIPFDVELSVPGSERRIQRVFPKRDSVDVVFEHVGRRGVVTINPGREIFDRDRFNNANEWSGIHFLPGDVSTVRDDAYTVVWAPFPSKLPGEDLSLNLGLQVFRYVTAGVSGVVQYIPSEKQLGYNLLYLKDLPDMGAYVIANLLENYGKNFKGERIFGLNLIKSPLFFSEPELALGVKIQSRQSLGIKDSQHFINGYSLRLDRLEFWHCSANMNVETEFTLNVQDLFSYQKDWAIARVGCSDRRLSAGLRLFQGSLRSRGLIADNVRFFPQDLGLARIRLDHPSLPSTNKIRSLNFDLQWPANLPLPSAFFALPRQSKWRIFADVGEVFHPSDRYEAAGLGYSLPIGGDIVGRRSLTVFRFTVLTVLHRVYDGQTDQRPGFLFDFTGKL